MIYFIHLKYECGILHLFNIRVWYTSFISYTSVIYFIYLKYECGIITWGGCVQVEKSQTQERNASQRHKPTCLWGYRYYVPDVYTIPLQILYQTETPQHMVSTDSSHVYLDCQVCGIITLVSVTSYVNTLVEGGGGIYSIIRDSWNDPVNDLFETRFLVFMYSK